MMDSIKERLSFEGDAVEAYTDQVLNSTVSWTHAIKLLGCMGEVLNYDRSGNLLRVVDEGQRQ
jgi:hypothetical protein